MFRPSTLVVLAMLLFVPTLPAAELKVVSQAATGAPGFLTGDLGMIDSLPNAKSQARDETLFRLSAHNNLQGNLAEYFSATANNSTHAAWDAVAVPGAGHGGESHLSISINGCFAGPDSFQCYATASGSGDYNYWWMFRGNGQLYQTNTNSATVSQCSGTGTLTVQVRDQSNGEISRSAPHRITCGGCGPGPGFCEE